MSHCPFKCFNRGNKLKRNLSWDIFYSLLSAPVPVVTLTFDFLFVLSERLTYYCNSCSPSFSLSLPHYLQHCYYSPRSPEEDRGEGRPCCRLCTVQMLFHLIHQCQLLPSEERQDAAVREVMKAP